jgi:hypothetical protein
MEFPLMNSANGVETRHVVFHCEATAHPQEIGHVGVGGPGVHFEEVFDPPPAPGQLPPKVLKFYEEVKEFPYIRISQEAACSSVGCPININLFV